jgi:hypothetical protein
MTNSPRSWHNVPPVYGTALYPEPLQIELITTLDDAICVMPPLDAGVWHVVRSGGPTLWRRIYLE